MRSTSVIALLTIAALAAACTDSTTPREPAVYSVTPAAQWSGGLVQVRSSFFVGLPVLPVVTAGYDTLAVSRLNDSTLAVVLPSVASGELTLTVKDGAALLELGQVAVFGFNSKRTIAPGLGGQIQMLPGAPPHTVVGTDAGDPQARNELLAVNLATDQVTRMTGVYATDFYGAAPSYLTNQVVAKDGTGALGIWALWPTPTLLGPLPFGNGYIRQLSQFNQDIWLATGSHQSVSRAVGPPPAILFSWNTESPYVVALSPTHDRATLEVSAVLTGVQVFDMVTGDTAYSLSLRTTDGVLFSADGSRLYAVGSWSAGATYSHRLQSVRASDGLVLHETTLPGGGWGYTLAVNAASDRLFVAGGADSTMHLFVYDANTLDLLGDLRAPDGCGVPPSYECFEAALVLDEEGGKAHYVIGGAPAPVWSFNLLP